MQYCGNNFDNKLYGYEYNIVLQLINYSLVTINRDFERQLTHFFKCIFEHKLWLMDMMYI